MTSSRVDALPEPPVIVATQLESARALLGDPDLAWESGHCALLDVGLRADRQDAFIVSDLDDAGWPVAAALRQVAAFVQEYTA